MIWLSWRQQRFETLLAFAALAVATALLLFTHQQIAATFNQLGISSCLRSSGSSGNACANAFSAFKDNVASERTLLDWLGYLPILIGALLAASVALEMEQAS